MKIEMLRSCGQKMLMAHDFKNVRANELPKEGESGEVPDKLAELLCNTGVAKAKENVSKSDNK